MKKKTVLISLAALSLLFSGIVGCNGNKESEKPASEPASQQSQPKPSSNQTPSSKPASQQATSEPASSAPVAHEHQYGEATVTVKNADGKDVYIKECKDKDDKYIGMAFGDYSAKDEDFDANANASKYGEVESSLWDDAVMLAKTSGTSISWKVNVDKAIEGAKLSFGVTSTYASHGSQDCAGKFAVKVNDGEAATWLVTGTFDENGVSPTARTYLIFQNINLVAGENTITLQQLVTGYRWLFGGEMRIHFSGDATVVASTPVPVEEGYEITFTHEHCKVLVYESGQDYSIDPVETDKTLSRDDNGVVCKYVAADAEQGIAEVKPQVNFKVVCDEGYVVDGECITISGTQGVEWNKLASQGQDIYRITKIKADITVNVVAKVKSAEEAPGYEATFKLSHCTVKVYLGKKNAEGDNIDTAEKYYTRDKDSGEYSKDGGQINFEVFPEAGYEFNSGLALGSSTSPAGVSFITNGTGGAANFSNFKVDGTNANLFSITKVSSNLIITITCTLVA